MRPIQLGIVNSPPLLLVTENSKLDGILAPYILNFYYFIINKTNVTFHPMAVLPVNFCPDHGTCNGVLSYVQSGEIDFTGVIGLDGLKSVGQNLSLLPTVWERNCYFSYSSERKTLTEQAFFFDFIFSFDFTFWICFLALSSIFILMNSFVLKYNHHFSGINIFWSQFDYLLSQYFVVSEQIQRKFFFLIFIIAHLIASKLLSASIKTGMLQQSDYLKLTSFTDVINHDFRPCFLLPANCGKLLNDSTDMNTRRSVDQAIWVNLAEKNTGDIFDMLKQNRYVSILDDSAYASVKTYGCLYEKEEEDKKPLILSEMPIYKHILGIAINKFALKSVNDVITKGSYAATEFGLFEHDRVKKLGVKGLTGFETPSSCLDENNKEQQVINASISLLYLFFPFIILIVGIISSLLIHLLI